MCEPATIGYAVAAVVGGALAAKAAAPKAPAAAAAPTTPTAPPVTTAQGAKQPDVKAMRTANNGAGAAGMNAGPSSTFLTGPTGVDPNTLTIGKNTLLGM